MGGSVRSCRLLSLSPGQYNIMPVGAITYFPKVGCPWEITVELLHWEM